MCGIFGIAVKPGTKVSPIALRNMYYTMFELSASRGVEAAGFALLANDKIEIQKQPVSSAELVKSSACKSTIDSMLQKAIPKGISTTPLALIGHSRLATNGLEGTNDNNQPVVVEKTVGVHYGIVVNDDELWIRHPERLRRLEVDTEILLSLVRLYLDESGDIVGACRRAFSEIKGSASIAVLFSDLDDLLLATNTGSLYVFAGEDGAYAGIMSERYMVEQFLSERHPNEAFNNAQITQVSAGHGLVINLSELHRRQFSLCASPQQPDASKSSRSSNSSRAILDPIARDQDSRDTMQRCTKCILPKTMPFIEFDDQGVCNYCRNHEPLILKGREAYEDILARYRRGDGSPDCIVAFSGGRDSSYALHQLKTEFGMTPLAYTYDWAMVNDLARRNQARLTGKLGVEHIIVSADIPTKRQHIKKNVEAWMKKPHLGMVPLFMAGDKQFFYFANRLKKQTGVELVIFAQSQYERTKFKTGFAEVKDTQRHKVFEISAGNKMSLASFYLKQFLLNPYYLNSSVFDTIFGFWSYYYSNRDYNFIFDYLAWDENVIVDTLINENEWETADDTTTTWRIGDGTAAIYNYIYHTVAGFTENDTFRSNQIREGAISRDEALKKVKLENQARFDSISEYCQTIVVNFNDFLRTVSLMPRLFSST